ncbi:MAG TPA: adenylate/guanylate cyclase domain-containing protein [Gaiellaceae bacterium]|nr:adenylate/guanylate cyclase domain-containing protein [Gaiellaceae bacterium]
MANCRACGEELPGAFPFCPFCGAPLEEGEAPREVRKTVTVVFCDLTGSTALGAATDPEALRATMRGYYDEMRGILERHGGTVEKFVGDAVMAVFGVPVAHEDDALRAVRAAWEMRSAVPALGLVARIGVNTGEVVAGEGDTLVTGDTVNVAARLEQAAEPGEVLVGSETQRLVRDAVRVEPVPVEAKGKGRVEAFRLVEVDTEAAPVARRFDVPLIGRGGELEQLRQAFDRAVRERRCHLFTLLGPAGVGKSRLVHEFLGGVDARVLEGRCLDYGEGITFWPVISVLKQLGDRGEPTLVRVVEGASTSNELFWVVRARLEEVALERPLVVCFDDIQWGEETFLDLVDHIADLSRGAPLFLLCVARPDLLDKRPGWGGGKLNATTLLLEPLSPEECAELIAIHGGVEPAKEERILAAADGNPLFVEEMVALVREDGEVRIPGTVQALLQARLDQLGRDERKVMERGAVEGQIFHRGAVLELTETTDVEPQLAGLVRKELIHPAVAILSGDHAFRFRHLLIRDAAYDALPKQIRAELHERFADWLERHGQELIELDEVLGYHLEQAAGYRRELGHPDGELERSAALRLGEAGAKAATRSDAHGAANLLRRALALLAKDDPKRAPLLIELIGALEGTGAPEEQFRLMDELEQSDDPAIRMHGRVARLQLQIMTDPVAVIPQAETVSQEALTLFEQISDDLGLAHTYYLIAWINWLQSRAVPASEAYQQVLEHARKANASSLRASATVQQAGPLFYGPFTVEEIRARLEHVEHDDSALARNTMLMVEADLAQRAGRFDEALALLEEAEAIHRELGSELGTAITIQNRADVLSDAGRLDEAVATYRDALVRLDELGMQSFRSTTLINLGETLYLASQVDEAERLALEGEELGAAEDVVNFALGRALRARLAADRGEHEEAERLARSGLEYAYTTDFPVVHAKAHAALGHALAAAGQTTDACRELDRTIELWSRHGYRVHTERARTQRAQL